MVEVICDLDEEENEKILTVFKNFGFDAKLMMFNGTYPLNE